MPLDPDKIALGWPNYIDEATLSGGAWLTTLPLSHIQDERFSVVAKTATTAPADTQFWITLPKRRRLHALGFSAHNLSAAATIRARVYRDGPASDLIYDSGHVNAWPAIYSIDDVIWGDINFWNRQPSEDDRKNYTPLSTLFFAERLIGTAAHVEINDPLNSEDSIALGRVMLTDIWQPEYNASWGIQHGYDTGTQITEAGDAARTRYARRVTPKRTVNFELKHLSESESFMRLHRLQRTQDVVGEILYIYSTRPGPENFQRAMVCHQTSLDPLVNPHYATFEHGMALLEKL